MATNDYWDYGSTAASNWGTSTNASTQFDTSATGRGWSSASSYYYPVTVKRTYLVTNPENWTEEQGLKFVELINIRTKTGFIVTLLIKGDVLITDPEVEKRTMCDFVPLLRSRANENDLKLINDFFETNPCN